MKRKKYRKKKPSPGYRIPKTELVGLEPIFDLIALALWTAYILWEKPVSLVLLARNEFGKTEALKKIRKNKGVYARRRFTAFGLIKDLLSGKIRLLFKKEKILGHILTYELANIFSFKANTVDSTLQLLNAYCEEGLSNESAFWIKGNELDDYEGLKGGIILGANPFGFLTAKTKRVKANLYKGGWISRLLVASYSLSEKMKARIFDSIQKEEHRLDKKFVDSIIEDFPKKRVHVILPARYSQEIRELAEEKAQEISEDLDDHAIIGFRLQKTLMTLVKASALRDGRCVVNQRDVERIKYLSQWFNLKMKNLKDKYPF
jgi:hypothetical protein